MLEIKDKNLLTDLACKAVKFQGLFLKQLKNKFCRQKGLSHVKTFPEGSWKSDGKSLLGQIFF